MHLKNDKETPLWCDIKQSPGSERKMAQKCA